MNFKCKRYKRGPLTRGFFRAKLFQSSIKNIFWINVQQRYIIIVFRTCTLAHEGKVPSRRNGNIEDHGHDGEGDGAAPDGRSTPERGAHHGHLEEGKSE